MDGIEATRRIRAQLPAQQQPYIIAMTANAMVEDREACAAAGMEEYLAKPVRAQELQRILARVNATITRPTHPDPPAESKQTMNQAPPQAANPVDQMVLTELQNEIGDEDGSVLEELIGDYLADSSRTVHELRVAVTIDDVSQILRLAHSWKSTSAILGATKLAALLNQAERAALQAPGELAAVTAEIEQEYERVSVSLGRLQSGGYAERV